LRLCRDEKGQLNKVVLHIEVGVLLKQPDHRPFQQPVRLALSALCDHFTSLLFFPRFTCGYHTMLHFTSFTPEKISGKRILPDYY